MEEARRFREEIEDEKFKDLDPREEDNDRSISEGSDTESLSSFTLEKMGLTSNQAFIKMNTAPREEVTPCCDHATLQKLASLNHRFQENGQQTMADMADILEALNRLGIDTQASNPNSTLDLGTTISFHPPGPGQSPGAMLDEIDRELAELDELVDSEMRKGR